MDSDRLALLWRRLVDDGRLHLLQARILGTPLVSRFRLPLTFYTLERHRLTLINSLTECERRQLAGLLTDVMKSRRTPR